MNSVKKITYTFSILAFLVALTGCSVAKNWAATGGSRADGVVKLSYEVGGFEKPVLQNDPLPLAIRRCQTWGYQTAEAFDASFNTCVFGSAYGCERYRVTREFQCVAKENTQ